MVRLIPKLAPLLLAAFLLAGCATPSDRKTKPVLPVLPGLTMLGAVVTTQVQDTQPVDDVNSIALSEGSFNIHVKWALDLDLVKQFTVRYEAIDGQSGLVSGWSHSYAPESPHFNSWQRIAFTNSSQPGLWRVAVYVSVGTGETKVVDTYLNVLPDPTASTLPPGSCPAIPGLSGTQGGSVQDLMSGSELWQRSAKAGMAAYITGNLPEAEKHFRVYLKEAEKFGPRDPRRNQAATALVSTLCRQGKTEEADKFSKRYGVPFAPAKQ